MSEKLLESISEAVLDGNTQGARQFVNEAVAAGIPVGSILNEGLIAGMNEVGELFRDGEMFVPEVLVSAKALQAGIDIIRPALVEAGIETAGTILTVTVEGDLHDIGIKLVGMMLEGGGFEVVNMGVDRPAKEIIAKIKEIRPNILGMSAMLTTTMANMKDVIDALQEEGLADGLKIMIGGAPTSPLYAEKIGAFYSADASDAVVVAKRLMNVS